MANRTFNQFQGSLEKGLVQLFAEVSFSGVGVPTLVRGKGIASVTRTAAGTYLVTLQDTYIRTLGLSYVWKITDLDPGNIIVLNEDDVANINAPTLELVVMDYSGAPTDLGVGAALLTISLSNSTAL